MSTHQMSAMRKLLGAALSQQKLEDLAMDLFFDQYEDLVGLTRSKMINEMAMLAFRHGRIAELAAYVKQENPYQYGLYEGELFPQPTTAEQTQLQSLEAEIRSDAELLQRYEEMLQLEGLLSAEERDRIQRAIVSKREAIMAYEAQVDSTAKSMGLTLHTEGNLDVSGDIAGGDIVKGDKITAGRDVSIVKGDQYHYEVRGDYVVNQVDQAQLNAILEQIKRLSAQVAAVESRL